MRYVNRILSLTLIFVFVLAVSPAMATDKPDGTVKMEELQIAFWVGIDGGRGTLHYQEKDYPFKVGGLKAGVTATLAYFRLEGEAYHLTKPEDLAGVYVAVEAGVALAGGIKGLTLQNEKGVMLKLHGTQAGVDLTMAVKGMVIWMK